MARFLHLNLLLSPCSWFENLLDLLQNPSCIKSLVDISGSCCPPLGSFFPISSQYLVPSKDVLLVFFRLPGRGEAEDHHLKDAGCAVSSRLWSFSSEVRLSHYAMIFLLLPLRPVTKHLFFFCLSKPQMSPLHFPWLDMRTLSLAV